MSRTEPTERAYVVTLTNGETVRPDICKVKESGWLYCCWTEDRPSGESVQRTYAPHAVEFYDSRPADEPEGQR
jgi:hypothetical protein